MGHFVLLGIEKARIVPGITPINPLDFYYMPYTHSLVAVILWSIAASAGYGLITKQHTWQAATTVGLVVFSHWVLDFIVHRANLPLYADTFKVGLGFYYFPAAALALEVGLLYVGLLFYLGTTKPLSSVGRYGMMAFSFVLLGLLAFVSFAPPLPSMRGAALSALVSYFVLAGIAYGLERQRALGLGAEMAD